MLLDTQPDTAVDFIPCSPLRVLTVILASLPTAPSFFQNVFFDERPLTAILGHCIHRKILSLILNS